MREFFPEDDGRPATGVNLVEFVGHSEEEVEAPLKRITDALAAEGTVKGRRGSRSREGHEDVERIWVMRKKGVGLLGNMKGDKRPIAFVEDAVPPRTSPTSSPSSAPRSTAAGSSTACSAMSTPACCMSGRRSTPRTRSRSA